MRILAFDCCALSSCVAAAMLAGCGGSQPPTGAPGAMAQRYAIESSRAKVRRIAPTSSSYHLLYSFPRYRAGFYPTAGLVDVRGMLYGTTDKGGSASDGYFANGIVYRTSTTGATKVLHRFGGGDSDGARPFAGLIEVNGTLYGTTQWGGSGKCANESGDSGCGTVYSISTSGKEKMLYSFARGSDGANPDASLIDVNGTLYGTTARGGASACSGNGCGTVYSISTTGAEKVLYSFAGGSDGANPVAGLIDVKGTLYGTTTKGGSSGNGTVYSISTTGTEKVLYSFAGGSDGANPVAGLIDVKGTLYGTTSGGGSSDNGTVYSISTTGTEEVLYSFRGYSYGGEPLAPLIDVKGALYGTTAYGTVYSISTTGAETLLYHFTGEKSGESPAAPLIVVNDTLYGTTTKGGSGCGHIGCGTIFTFSL